LLVAGGGPFWRNDLGGARVMFEEALDVARANAEGDPWAEARALGSLSMLVSETGDEEESLALAAQGLAIAEGKRDRFSIATAKENVAGALRRLGKLDEALAHADAAVDGFRELGAKWELASALTSRGNIHRFDGRPGEAVRDLREAYRLCRELQDRSIVDHTASSLAKALADAGELGAARRVVAEAAGLTGDRSSPVEALLDAEVEILLAEGDRETALAKAQQLLALERRGSGPKDVAARVWWVGRLFGEDAAGGRDEVGRARALLEEVHLVQALRRPDLLPPDRQPPG
jgi:tetratricopeptide (TPR) repeat protein